MRLINTSTLKIKNFTGKTPQYAILSHRWDDAELTLQDMDRKDLRVLPGYSKIQGCCAQARNDGIEWAWIDSCCIDKTSSAELSEAINSMFQWYKSSRVCYTYLVDVTDGVNDIQRGGHQFLTSQWFTRGWTLQELLAPKYLMFFDSSWQYFGARNDWQTNDPSFRLGTFIERATGIKNIADWHNASVACKMSWAAGRLTTREEDRAYSLMGLFGVNMPPLYGEGPRAFHRLQLEILRETDDESIFAWADPYDLSGGLLAPSIDAFRGSGGVIRTHPSFLRSTKKYMESSECPPYSMTNKGLHFPAHPLGSVNHSKEENETDDRSSTVRLYLNSTDTRLGNNRLLCIKLERVSLERNQWVRINAESLLSLSESEQAEVDGGILNSWRSFYVRQLGRYESPFQGPFNIMLPTSALVARGFKYTDFAIHKAYFMQDRYKLTQLEDGVRMDIDCLLMTGLTVGFMFSKTNSQHVFLVLNIKDFQISATLLGPYTYRHRRDLLGQSERNLAIFDDFFALPNWRLRSRETRLYCDGDNLEIRARVNRIWKEGEQGYVINFIVENLPSKAK